MISPSLEVNPLVTHTAVYRLSLPLVVYLKANIAGLDSHSKDCLRDVQTLIGDALQPQEQTKSPSSVVPESQINSSRTAIDGNSIYVHGPTLDATLQRANSSNSNTSRSGGGIEVSNVYYGDSQKRGEGKRAKSSSKEQRAPKKRALVAVQPFAELTDKDSNTNAMATIFGEKFARWWFQYKILNAFLTTFAVFWNAVLGLIYFLAFDIWEQHSTWMAFTTCLVLAQYVLQYLSIVNPSLIKRCFQTYDARWILLEVFLYVSSFWALNCFSKPLVTLILALVMVSVPFLFYDTYPITVRRKSRPFLIWGFILFATYLSFFYSKFLEEHMCFYRVDLFHGLVPEEDVLSGKIKLSRWSFTLFDFCVNRALTLLALKLRILYSSYRHPHDCVILRSRLRLVEFALYSNGNNKTKTKTQFPEQADGAGAGSLEQKQEPGRIVKEVREPLAFGKDNCSVSEDDRSLASRNADGRNRHPIIPSPTPKRAKQ